MTAAESKVDGYLQEKAMYTLSEIVDIVRILKRAADRIPSDMDGIPSGCTGRIHKLAEDQMRPLLM